MHYFCALCRAEGKHRLKGGRLIVGGFLRFDSSLRPGFIGRIVENSRPKPALDGGFPVLHSRRRVLPKMVLRKVMKILHIVVRA